MTTQAVHSGTANADLFLPADGLSLLGEDQGSGYAGRRFLVGRSDGEVVQLSLLTYLIMAAIAEGGLDGGWSADQVGASVAAASGQGLTADNVRYLIAGKLAPVGLIAAGRADRPDGAPGAAPGAALTLWVNRLPGLRIRGVPLRDRWALALGAAAVLVSVAAAAPIMAGAGNGVAGGNRSASASLSSASASASAAASAAAAASRSQAAAWVAQQVSPDVTVFCDPGMCRQLRQDGFPAARLKPLPGSARMLPGSGVVVATAAVRRQLAARLAAAYAPQLIAGFGAGAARVDVAVLAPAGPGAFGTQRAAERIALASAGRQLLGNQNIQASSSARAALRAGQVDARLLTILSLLSAQLPVRLVRFTGAPGAGLGAPLRGAEIGVASPAAGSAVVALLNAQQGLYRPAITTVVGGSRPVVTLRFDAPADLDISQP